MDIVCEIKKLSDHRNIFTHVYGHQDVKGEILTPEAYLNTIADKISHSNATTPVQIHPKNQTAIYINNQYIPYNHVAYLRKVIGAKNTKSS